jgi:hypothetical protein
VYFEVNTCIVGTLDVSNNVTFKNDLDVSGNVNVEGTLDVSNKINTNEINVSNTFINSIATSIDSDMVEINDNVIALNARYIPGVATGIRLIDVQRPSIITPDISTNIFMGWSGRLDECDIKNKFFIGRVNNDFDVSGTDDSAFNVVGLDEVDTYITGNVFSKGRNLYDWSQQIYTNTGEIYNLVENTLEDFNYTGSWPMAFGDTKFGTICIMDSNLVETYVSCYNFSNDFSCNFGFIKIGEIDEEGNSTYTSSIPYQVNETDVTLNVTNVRTIKKIYNNVVVYRNDIFSWSINSIVGTCERLRITMIFTPIKSPMSYWSDTNTTWNNNVVTTIKNNLYQDPKYNV